MCFANVGCSCSLQAQPHKLDKGRRRRHNSVASKTWSKVEEIEADDDHELQSFPLSVADETTALKVVFDETTDFYGRVIVYQLQVWGKEVGE